MGYERTNEKKTSKNIKKQIIESNADKFIHIYTGTIKIFICVQCTVPYKKDSWFVGFFFFFFCFSSSFHFYFGVEWCDKQVLTYSIDRNVLSVAWHSYIYAHQQHIYNEICLLLHGQQKAHANEQTRKIRKTFEKHNSYWYQMYTSSTVIKNSFS